jgi:hypothetical protein
MMSRRDQNPGCLQSASSLRRCTLHTNILVAIVEGLTVRLRKLHGSGLSAFRAVKAFGPMVPPGHSGNMRLRRDGSSQIRLPYSKEPTTLRSPDAAQRAASSAAWCAAAPGPLRTPALGKVPALRSGMKNAAPRPGHVGRVIPAFLEDCQIVTCSRLLPALVLVEHQRAFRGELRCVHGLAPWSA